MNKRITSLLLCVVMVFSMLATAVPALAAPPASSCTYSIEADKTSANPGDTINFTIYMQQTGNQNTLEGTLVIPDGLTFVKGSGKLEDGIKATLGWDSVEWTPVPNMILNGFGSESFTGTDKLAVMKFQCTVDNDATAKDYEVTLIELVADDENYETKNPTCIPATITVSAAPVAVRGVTIDETLSVNIGQTKTPSYTVAPAEATNKTVSFTSDNPAVATVNATTGEVTGVSKGTAIITVKTADGNFTDTCTVTVSCAHTNKSTVPAQDSTCTVKGWDEYKKCDDCGQLFNTSDVEIDEIPFLNLANHTGGTATCTAQAVCSVCDQPYGDYAAHSYTAETKKAEALKTAGNCRDKAVYYYSCSVCGNVEHNDAHTFEGDKDANTHVGGTSTVNAREPDHKNQVDGYTGDTKCLGCGEIIATGTSIPAGAHTPSTTWNSDGTYHWKECATTGCGVVIDGSKAKHSSTGTNVATCQHKAVCDVCNVEYGELAAHNPASGWTSDASGHWHACQTANCTEKCDFASHTPDHTGQATEEYAINCTECGYVIEAQLGHTHSYSSDWKSNSINHWHECSCGAKTEEAAHTAGEWIIDTAATATTDGTKHKECTECGYVMKTGTIPATGSGSGGGGGVSTYAITVDSAKNGDVTSSHKSAAKGTTVTITVEPDKGYTLETITATDASGNKLKLTEKDGKYTFTMPASKVTVKATFMEDNSMLNFFVDVPANAYYYDAVLWAAKNGITGGVDYTHFAPNAACTRAQAVTFLWRAAGSPAPKSSEMPFEDVAAGSYYYDAVLWAVENGITDGTSATAFSPNATCSRGQIVTFLWRSQKSPASDSVNPFTDVAADAYYNSAVLWAVTNGITDGTSATTFSPAANCTRAQIVTFLYRFFVK